MSHGHHAPKRSSGPGPLRRFLGLPPMPMWMFSGILILLAALTIPPAMVFRSRFMTMPVPRIHIFQDMDNQAKYKAQSESPVFADGRTARPKIPGTVALGKLQDDDHFERGYTLTPAADKTYTTNFFADFPAQIQLTREFLERGQQRYNIYCVNCHGYDGSGNGSVHVRADQLAQAGTPGMAWVQPSNLHTKQIIERPSGHLYNTINVGIRNMAGYGHAIPAQDRWAIVAYIRALQLSQHAPASIVPADKRAQLGLPGSDSATAAER